jgi:regulatory protein
MFSKPRKLDTEAELYEVALRALTRRAHSVHEMKQKLQRRSDNALLVQVVMARLKENGLLDDTRYAKQFVRQRTQIRRQGKYRIARDLRARGVPDRHIESALEESADDATERAALRLRIHRKLKLFRGPHPEKKIDDRKIASLYRSLLHAGFPSDAIRRELKAVTNGELPEVDTES